MIVFNQGVLFCSQRSASQRSTRSAVPTVQCPAAHCPPQRSAPQGEGPPPCFTIKTFFLKVNNKLIYYNIIFFKITCIIF